MIPTNGNCRQKDTRRIAAAFDDTGCDQAISNSVCTEWLISYVVSRIETAGGEISAPSGFIGWATLDGANAAATRPEL